MKRLRLSPVRLKRLQLFTARYGGAMTAPMFRFVYRPRTAEGIKRYRRPRLIREAVRLAYLNDRDALGELLRQEGLDEVATFIEWQASGCNKRDIPPEPTAETIAGTRDKEAQRTCAERRTPADH
jgi:hypothetical protein